MSQKLIVGDMIRYYLQQNKMTIKELGLKLGKGESTVSKWINNKNMPMAKDLSAMTLIFNTDIQTLMYGASEKAELITKTDKVMRVLVPDRQQNVYDYADNQLKEQQADKVVAMPTKEPCSEVEVEGVLSAGIGEQLDDNSGSFTVMVPSPIPANYDHAFQVNGHSMEPVYPDRSIVFVKEEEEYRDGQVVAAIINDDAFIKKLSIDCGHATLLSLNPAYPNVKVDEDEGVRIIGVVFK